MSASTNDILALAAAHIEMGWTRRAAARQSNGRSVPPDWNSACRWCVEGALEAAAIELGVRTHRWGIIYALADKIGDRPYIINDRAGSKQEMLALLSEAVV
jgi:hypothetical protein